MQDHQVEVVPGPHAAARVAGAVVLVAHRGPGRPTEDSPAVRALVALVALAHEAAIREPDGPGALIAREATRWLTARAGTAEPPDFGILSAAGPDRAAIFLHGAVTAVLDGTVTEYLHGRDATFTVDRAAEVPSRAVALFVDDARGENPDDARGDDAAAEPRPELPAARGIGRLVEGIAEAGGVVSWSPAPTPDPHQARTEISGRRNRPPSLDPLADETRDSRPHPGDARPPTGPAHRTPHREQPLTGLPLHGPPERSAAPPEAELRRRTAATAKGAAMTVKVRGFKCARAHPTDPRAAFCSVCGMPVDQTQPLIDVVRPPLGILLLDDGATHVLDTDSVIGRDPETSEPARRGLTPLKLADNSGGMSRAHVELILREWDVTVVDRGSTNGTSTRVAGHTDWVRIPPNHPVVLVPRTEILIGKRILRFESAAPPPFGS